MKNNFAIRKRQVESILYLMITFLPLSSIANYFHNRIEFTYLYTISSIITLYIFYKYKKKKQISKIAKQILILLYIIFFSFLILGDQRSFDIFWVLTLPLIVVTIENYKNLKKWLYLFLFLLILSLVLSYLDLEIISYDSFALWSLLWAGIFISYMSYDYKRNQNDLKKQIKEYQNNLEKKVEKATEKILDLNTDLEETQKEIIQRLGTLGEYRSNETGAHVYRVGLYSKKLALLAGLDEHTAEQLNLTAPLHDIGKVGIEDSILNKAGKLTNQEFTIMKAHSKIGAAILSNSKKPLIQMACEIAGGHHEKWDGSGYPRGLKKEEIPLSARIVAIADVFDALFSKRVYKEKWNLTEIENFFKENSSFHFDPKLCDLFLQNIDQFRNIYNENPN